MIYMKLSKKHKSLEIDHREVSSPPQPPTPPLRPPVTVTQPSHTYPLCLPKLYEKYEDTRVTANWNTGAREECEKQWQLRLDEAREAVDALKTQIEQSMSDSAEREERDGMLLQEKSQRIEDLERSEAEQTQLIEEFKSTVRSNKEHLHDMETSLTARDKEVADLKGRLVSTREERDVALKDLEESKQINATLKMKVSELEIALANSQKNSGEGAANLQSIITGETPQSHC